MSGDAAEGDALQADGPVAAAPEAGAPEAAEPEAAAPEGRPHAPGLSVIAFALGILAAGTLPSNVLQALDAFQTGWVGVVVGALLVAFPAVTLVGAAGLYFRKAWARPIVTVVAVVSLLALVSLIAGTPFGFDWLLPLLFAFALAAILLYLRKPHVAAALG